jgi:hypothetical protein
MALVHIGEPWLKVLIADSPDQGRGVPCSFCLKPYHQIGPLVEGPKHVFICDSCIDCCRLVMDRSKRERGILPPLPLEDEPNADAQKSGTPSVARVAENFK